jgi:steroid delta-isomerase-like uncharacterized protein
MTAITRFVEMINTHSLTEVREVIADDITEEGPVVLDAPTGGIDAFVQGWQQMLDSFPDIHVTITDTIAEDDRVAARISLHATNTGFYRRAEATNRTASWTGVIWVRLRDGKIAHFAGLTDRFAVLQQLGFIGSDDDLAPRASHTADQ